MMDQNFMVVLKARLWRIIHQLEAQTYQSLDEIKHESECVASIISALSCDYELSTCLQHVISAIEEMDTSLAVNRTQNRNVQSCPTTAGSGLVGRPSFIIPAEHLEFLIGSGFKVQQIADICGVSKRTITRRLSDTGISVSAKFCALSDDELDEKVTNILHNFPNIGYRSVKAHLLSSEFCVQETRVRDSMRRVDLEGVMLRQMMAAPVRRRSYNVLAPNSLWHIDGYHKLIRWRLVIHGGIDGYSRMPVYLTASNNNRARTVLESFIKSVGIYGLPDRVRSDKGGENVLVAEYMIENRGAGRGSHIAGRSVHNQRIERFWRDLWTGCIVLFYNLFHYMETTGVLDPDDEIHLEALHYIFIPRIQDHMDRFVSSFIRRPLSTARNQTPLQLWIHGQIYHSAVSLTSDTEIEDYGACLQEGMYVAPDDIEAVEIPQSCNQISEQKMHELQSLVQPLEFSNFHGEDLFVKARNFLRDNL